MNLTEEQWRIIENVLGILAGAGSSIGIQWFAKKKTKGEAKDTHTDNLLKGSDALVDRTQEVVEMLQSVLENERKNFRVEIEDLRSQIAVIREEHRSQMKNLVDDNDALNLRVGKLTTDNHELNIQLVKLTSSNEGLTKQVADLKKRLGKYETDMNDTGNHKAVKMG
jgi:predicted  nucleic acid-binding Zn-ribbon protein